MHSVGGNFSGIGLRAAHYQALLDTRPAIGWIEVHPENYFCGGVHTNALAKARLLYPVSFHAVGLSLGSADQVNKDHLRQLKELMDRFDPIRISDHASWSTSGNAHLGDLLPLPYNKESMTALCRNIDITQQYLGRSILIENPSSYLTFTESTMNEPEFLVEVAHRTGCGLLLDINNIYVQAHNHGFDAHTYLNAIPPEIVGEIHLAGHTERLFENGTLLVDTHDQLVRDEVWALYDVAISRLGAVPTLIEWDKDIPALDVLVGEAQKAGARITKEQNHEAV